MALHVDGHLKEVAHQTACLRIVHGPLQVVEEYPHQSAGLSQRLGKLPVGTIALAGVLAHFAFPVLVQIVLQGIAHVVVDMGSTFDKKVQRVMEMADQVLLVTDGTETSRVKCNQFRTQHNMYLQLKEKLIVVANRGDKRAAAADEKCIVLPKENSSNPKVLYKMLASYFKSLQE